MSLQYVPSESSDISVDPFTSGAELPSLGIATDESAVNSASFLIAESSMEIRPRRIPLNDGSIRVQFDQLENPDTVLLTPAGVWSEGVVLYGTVGTASDSNASKALMKAFERGFKKHFTKVKAYWVGPRAFARLKDGNRLTIAAQSPRDFDLTLAE